jgi:error-prone DNA polymerase
MKLAIVAADYTPGEADQLRRDMAAWRKTGRIEQHRSRLVGRMQKKGLATEFAERVFEQIRGFGEYGFPESHAASFALVSYAGAWLRRHHAAAFTCGLLDAQPMGFYTPATIVEDARRHGVEIRPIDVRVSSWSCSLEPAGKPPPFPSTAPDDASKVGQRGGRLAVRMGLRYVRGLSEADGRRLEACAPFTSIEDLAERSGLNPRVLETLATAGALRGLESARRQALWQVRGVTGTAAIPMATLDDEPAPALAPLGRQEAITWDLAASGHSTLGHPLGPLRAALARAGLPDARTVSRQADGVRIQYAGLVICRQRPGTASGVTFMTLEDETGFVNVVLWKRVFDEHGVIARTQGFLGVAGRIQSHEGVVHLVAESLFVVDLAGLPTSTAEQPGPVPVPQSRDFR